MGTVRLQVRQVDMGYHAIVEPPAFDLGARWVDLQSAIYSRLKPFNLRLPDIKIESSSSNPADISIVCWVLSYAALVRFRLDKVEFWSNSTRLAANSALATDVAEQAVEILHIASPEARVASHSLTVALHGEPQGKTPDDFITDFLRATPPGTPELRPSGVSFAGELPTKNGAGSIVLERSAQVSEGVFLRISSEHAGSLTTREALGQGIEFIQESLKRLGFEADWGQ
jgi:hypothetical protein